MVLPEKIIKKKQLKVSAPPKRLAPAICKFGVLKIFQSLAPHPIQNPVSAPGTIIKQINIYIDY